MKFNRRKDGQGGGLGKNEFLRLKDGDSVKGVFRGEPSEFYMIWEDGRGRAALPDEKGSFRFRINIVVSEGGGYVAKVFEQGRGVYDQLAALNDDYPLENFVMKISRKGSGPKDTIYAILPLPDGKLTDEQKAKIAAVKLHELKPRSPEKPEEKKEPAFDDVDEPPTASDDDIPDFG